MAVDEDTAAAPEDRPVPGRVARMLTAPELRWIYLSFVFLLSVFGATLVGLAVHGIFNEMELPAVLLYSGLGAFFLFVALGTYRIREYLLRLHTETVTSIRNIELRQFDEEDFDHYDQVRRLREEKARADFERNLAAHIVLRTLTLRDVLLFSEARWELQPGLNVLLGRNGYGKSLLLRGLAGVLQRDEDSTDTFFSSNGDGSEPEIHLRVERDGEAAPIRRSPVRFVESIGKVPLLAIPDSRFIDRSKLTVTPVDRDTADLRENGAHHFLHQEPYGEVIQALLYEICLDYWERGRSFDLPVFEFLRHCAGQLTDADFRFRSIERSGRTGFEILVSTEGNEEPIPIQYASQGTLSVLAMFGLIRSFVRSLSSDLDDDLAEEGSAIVFIDEADAHLHPVWQQKVPTLLKDLFPNVQFVLSAHSPLFVAGCWRREAAVLRKANGESPASFTVEQLDRDFVGATSAELYEEIFEIEELDETYLEYSAKATLGDRHTQRISELTGKQGKGKELSDEEEQELRRIIEERRRINRAADRKRQREDPQQRIDHLETQVMDLQSRLGEREEGSAA